MKTILITTDFSDASRNATIYGLQMAKALEAKAVLFHAYEIPALAPDSIIIESFGKMAKIAADQMTKECALIADTDNYPFDAFCEEGIPADIILKKAKDLNAAMIVSGFRGKGKAIRQIFGSTATSLTKHATVPVLIVPEKAKFSSMDSILFANDISVDTDIHVLDDLKEIVEKFKARLYVVKVVKNKTEEWHEVLNTPETLLMAVRKLDSEFDYPIDKDIIHALNDFTEKHHVQLVAMMPHKHFWLDLFFGKSNTKDMIFHTKVPLLILPERNYEEQFREMKTHGRLTEGLVM